LFGRQYVADHETRAGSIAEKPAGETPAGAVDVHDEDLVVAHLLKDPQKALLPGSGGLLARKRLGGSMSQITKRALEASLKNLLAKRPLDKITVTDITEDCGINRMTFYYHFKDIYDLVEWACIEDATRALAGKKTAGSSRLTQR